MSLLHIEEGGQQVRWWTCPREVADAAIIRVSNEDIIGIHLDETLQYFESQRDTSKILLTFAWPVRLMASSKPPFCSRMLAYFG